jgi:hypothetical protein
MKYIFPFALIVLALTSCVDSTVESTNDSANSDSAGADSVSNSMSIGGTYGFGSNPEVEAVGSLLVYPESDTTFLFALDFTRGAPSYNMGNVYSRAHLRNGTWTYDHAEPNELDVCAIDFMFKEKFVQLVTREKGCGFGANVIVDHVYDRTSSVVPQYFVGMEGDTVLFTNLATAVR